MRHDWETIEWETSGRQLGGAPSNLEDKWEKSGRQSAQKLEKIETQLGDNTETIAKMGRQLKDSWGTRFQGSSGRHNEQSGTRFSKVHVGDTVADKDTA